MKRFTLMAAASVAVVLVAGVARAEPVVLAIDGKDIYVDLGAKDGVGAGSELELLHEVVARDPRSGNVLRDRFALGTITVVKSGEALSVARADGELATRVAAGDRVRLVSAKRTFADPWAAQVAASKGQAAPTAGTVATAPTQPGGAAIDHAALAREAWQDTLGQPPDKRIERWNALLAQDPQSPYRRAIEQEVASLQAQIKLRHEALEQARSTADSDRGPRIARLTAQLPISAADRQSPLTVAPIERAVPGRPIALAFLVRQPARIRAAWLYARPAGAAGFTRSELVRDGDAYLRGTIAGELVRGGHVDWYVELANEGDDDAEPGLGSQRAPRVIEIDRQVGEAPIEQGRTHIDAHVDYVDFDGGFNKGYDQYYQAELDFTYRFIEPVYAVRLGFGSLSGIGGPKDVIDADPMGRCLDETGTYRCERMTFSYVYTEVEMRLRPNVAIMLRPQAGILTTDTMDTGDAERCRGADTAGCRFLGGFGARGRIRLGQESGTNLVLGAAFTSRVGTLLEAAYHWLPNRVVPVQITVQVTDQPVLEDFGVRLIADVGLRQLTWFYPSVRLSYQARDIDHSGLSGGFALNFDW
jgi:hypothetical protein